MNMKEYVMEMLFSIFFKQKSLYDKWDKNTFIKFLLSSSQEH